MTGYSKYHFCSRFKSLTGMTYLNYLNSVRVRRACLLLQQGESVQAVCRATGFENVSYFIQMFKKIRHVTPINMPASTGDPKHDLSIQQDCTDFGQSII